VAPERVSVVLALEIHTNGKAAFAEGPAQAYSRDSCRECDLGRGAHRQRTAPEARHSVIVACDFFVVVTATFRTLYVFVIMELGSRRILHHNVTPHPTAEWTTQQFQEALPGGHAYRFLIHDRDSIFSKELDEQVSAMGVKVLRTPVRAPKADSVCERFGGTMRREFLDYLIPFNERHLRFVLEAWIAHFNSARPHMSLSPGIPSGLLAPVPYNEHRHRIPDDNEIRRVAVLGGLHHEYRLEKVAA